MRLLMLTALTMTAFAANSVLNRLALIDGETGPAAFAAIRLISGAAVLAPLLMIRGGHWPGWSLAARWKGVASLALYILGFSFAYVSLDAGLGALILFAGVQVTMFAGALFKREVIPPTRWLGAGVALFGLAVLLWPAGGSAPPTGGALLMLAAALGWGIYSLAGRGATDPLGLTAANFLLAAPIGLLVLLIFRDAITPVGAILAAISGGITSGLGYALWYAILPRLEASIAAVAQLTVPIIALAGGIVFLSEDLTMRFAIASCLVLGGVALSIRPGR